VESDEIRVTAYRLNDNQEDADLWAAPIQRAWMEAMPQRFANRCLPLLIANQSGWLLINTETVRLTWDGGRNLDAVRIDYDGEPQSRPFVSHFGSGIVTYLVPYLFRTSPGWNLLVRGPSNCPKDGIYPLEGVVETDWATATFTMNWHLTRPGLTVTFARGEPVAMVVPQRRGDLERVRPRIENLSSNPEIGASYSAWQASRQDFLADLDEGGLPRGKDWQRHYFRGRTVDGEDFPEHQTRLRIADFVDGRSAEPFEE
jgi:antitoxin (DNA-binding transcriptional repressor) of toxin-antitoxin stability system